MKPRAILLGTLVLAVACAAASLRKSTLVSMLIFAVPAALIIIWYRLRTRGLGTEAQELFERP